ncbi:MAG: type 1 glutamine amidotransferase [Patulibacter minatonensis]
MKPLLVVQHVPWEGPHTILEAFAGVPVEARAPLTDGRPLPGPGEISGAVFMGGPMSVHDTVEHPALADEVEWLGRAHAAGVPLLGVCLGSQLIAKALGATIVPGPRPEIGWAAIDVLDPADPLAGTLRSGEAVLHWHGERFSLPAGATPLACSDLTPLQAFRHGNAWGFLFHAEADAALVEAWLAEPSMLAEARAALGPDAAEQLRAGSARIGAAPGRAMFRAFAARCGAG